MFYHVLSVFFLEILPSANLMSHLTLFYSYLIYLSVHTISNISQQKEVRQGKETLLFQVSGECSIVVPTHYNKVFPHVQIG